VIGLAPLWRANYHTYKAGHLVSLTNISETKSPVNVGEVYGYARNYFSQGNGALARNVVLGESTNSGTGAIEGALIFVTLLMIASFTLFLPRDVLMRLSGVMALTYVLIAAGLFLLPRPTYVHHWVIGTPFQYCAIALASIALEKMIERKISRAWTCRLVLVIAVMLLIGTRLLNLIPVEMSLAAGKSSPGFDAGFSRLAEFAGKSSDAFFIAADWGTATQIYCGSDGDDEAVGEPFWNPDPVETALAMARSTKKNVLYIVMSGLDQPWNQSSSRILNAMRELSGWHEVPMDSALTNRGPVEMHKFHR
jgi:hypothetical protein